MANIYPLRTRKAERQRAAGGKFGLGPVDADWLDGDRTEERQ